MRKDKKHKQQAKRSCRNDEEIGGDQLFDVNRRQGVRLLFECDPVPGDHGPVEGQPGLRAVLVLQL